MATSLSSLGNGLLGLKVFQGSHFKDAQKMLFLLLQGWSKAFELSVGESSRNVLDPSQTCFAKKKWNLEFQTTGIWDRIFFFCFGPKSASSLFCFGAICFSSDRIWIGFEIGFFRKIGRYRFPPKINRRHRKRSSSWQPFSATIEIVVITYACIGWAMHAL